ncbi:MAG: hypothetical protein QM731_01315 [Chitinophagaceae bacterium]
MKKITTILVLHTGMLLSATAQVENIQKRLITIQHGLDTMIFVNRFESIETPCLCISALDSSTAMPNRRVLNSNCDITLNKKGIINPNGVKCLSQYVARYLRLRVQRVDFDSLLLTGTVETTYAYPASSLIQLLGFTQSLPAKTDRFFDKLIKVHGTFRLYPEADKYRISLTLTDEPFSSDDTYLGYLEIVRDVFDSSSPDVYVFSFDQMSIQRGDNNNQIAVKFSSTSHRMETAYHTILAYNVLKHIKSTDLKLKANAIWLDNFLKNPLCPQCRPVYVPATFMVNNLLFALPNTSPVPAH